MALVQDRYRGIYSGGEWLAIAEADASLEEGSRVDWVLKCGPNGDDVEARKFWAASPHWIASAQIPDAALVALFAKNGYDNAAIAQLLRGPFGSLSNDQGDPAARSDQRSAPPGAHLRREYRPLHVRSGGLDNHGRAGSRIGEALRRNYQHTIRRPKVVAYLTWRRALLLVAVGVAIGLIVSLQRH